MSRLQNYYYFFYRSSNSTKREPIIRVLPLTIDLVNNVTTTDSMDSDYDQHDCLLSPEWTVACGQVYYKDKNGDVCPHGLLAVTSVRSYIRIKSYHSRVIQLWCADSGNLLFDLKRYCFLFIPKIIEFTVITDFY